MSKKDRRKLEKKKRKEGERPVKNQSRWLTTETSIKMINMCLFFSRPRPAYTNLS